MDLNKLRVFVKVAELKSVTMAAKSLNLSAATVSRYIASLQESLKRKIYVHKGKYIEITEYGEHLGKISREFIKGFEDTLSFFEDQTDPISGYLKVLCPYKLGEIWLLNKLDSFRERYSQIRFTLCFEDSQISSFLNQADIAILPYKLTSGNFIQKLLFSSPLSFFASSDFLKSSPSFHEKNFEPYCIMSITDENDFAVKRPYVVDNHSIVMSCIQQNIGIGLIPEFLGKRAGLVQMSVPEDKRIQYYIAYHSGLKNDKKVSLFKEFIAKNIYE